MKTPMEKIIETLAYAINGGSLIKIILAGKRRKSIEYKKITVRPVDIKGEYMYRRNSTSIRRSLTKTSRTTKPSISSLKRYATISSR